MNKYFINTYITAGFCGSTNEILRTLILTDSYFCHAAVNSITLSDAQTGLKLFLTDTDWKNIDNAIEMITNVQKIKRSYFYRTITNKSINRIIVAFRGALHARLLLLISTNVPNRNWLHELNHFMSILPEDWYKQLRRKIAEELIDHYWDAYEILSENDIRQLKFRKESYKIFSKKMLNLLKHYLTLKESAPKPASEQNNDFFSHKTNKVRLQCLVESYLADPDPSKPRWEQYLRKNWKEYNPKVSLTDSVMQQIAYLLVLDTNANPKTRKFHTNSERYFKALGIAIRSKRIQNIYQETTIRTLVLNRTIAMVVSLLDPEFSDSEKTHAMQTDEVVDDILAYLSYMNYVSTEAENDDIIEILDNYLENGYFNRTSLRLLYRSREVWRQSYLDMKEFLSHRNKAVSVLNDKIDEMETSLAKANYDSLKRFVLELDRGSFGCRLGQMYRCAKGYDTFSVQDAIQMFNILFDQLNNMGIKPVAEEFLNQRLLEENELFDQCISESSEITKGTHTLYYPGWSINGSTVALPIYKTK